VTQSEYEQWIAEKKAEAAAVAASAEQEWSMQDLLTKGESVYAGNCAACHGPTGAGIPGVFPAIANSPIATGDAAEHMNLVMNGRSGTAMAAYKTQLSDVDLAAVITFERNSFGNSTGDMVQPLAIKNAR
jgi:cytochrome c oxidase subunit 2